MYRTLLLFVLALLLINCKEPAKNEQKLAVAIENTEEIYKNSPASTTMKKAEIVFCLDATGSMSGLIGTAKEKIWDIVSEMTQSQDIDSLKLGMVFYRDRGDHFVTKHIALTTDIDQVYTDLLEIQADGGGDTPESVNQALHEAVDDMNWSADKNTYKTVFVVGDCPPHMDYQNDILYTESCEMAAQKGIRINTIKLGATCREAIPHFKKMASCTNGEFMQLDQNATDVVINTPYDDEINKVSKEIDDSRLYYGKAEERRSKNLDKSKLLEMVYTKGSSSSNSARASYKMSKSDKESWMDSQELGEDYESGKIKLAELKESELPVSLQGKSLQEKEATLNELVSKRATNMKQLKELSKKRRAFIVQKSKERSSKDSLSFSKQVLKIIEKQSKSN